jgi:hypothetical protein
MTTGGYGGNEAKRKEFITPFLYSILCRPTCVSCPDLFKGKITVDFEVDLVGKMAPISGSVEFTISIGKSIVCVLEAKNEKFDQGRAQSLLEIEVIREVHFSSYISRGPERNLPTA